MLDDLNGLLDRLNRSFLSAGGAGCYRREPVRRLFCRGDKEVRADLAIPAVPYSEVVRRCLAPPDRHTTRHPAASKIPRSHCANTLTREESCRFCGYSTDTG